MAQRTGGGTPLLSLCGMAAPLSIAFPGPAEESQPVPAGARDLAGNRTQGAIVLPFVLEAVGQDLDRDGLSLEGAAQDGARRRDATIVAEPPSICRCAHKLSRLCLARPTRRPYPQIGFIGDFTRPPEGSLRQAALG